MAFDTVIDKTQLEKELKATADSIREKTSSTNSIEWKKDTGFSEAISGISTGSIEENRLVFTGAITETYIGSGVYATLIKSDKLAKIRNESSLFVRVEFDIERTPYTIVKTWGANSTTPMDKEPCQWMLRFGSDATDSINRSVIPLNTTSPIGVGCLQITEDGELRIYSNSSSNYAIRPSNWKAIIEW